MDIRKLRNVPKPEVFMKAFDSLFRKIVPDFEIKCNNDIEKDNELLRLYITLKEEHMKVVTTLPSNHRFGQGSRPNYNYNNDRRNGNRS